MLPINNCVRALREQHGGMTQAELGERVKLTRQTIAAIEQRRYSPSLEAAFLIARVFAKPLEDVFWFDERVDS